MSESYHLSSFIIAWISLSLCAFGFISNLTSLAIYSHPLMRSPINILLSGLSIIDLFLCLLAIAAFCIPGMAVYYNTIQLGNLVAYAAVYIYPWTMVAQSASVWTFVVITCERFIAVCYPFKVRWCTINRSLRALGIVASFAFLYNIPRFFEFELTAIELPDDQILVTAEAKLRNSSAHRTYMTVYYCAFYLLTHFAIPFSILLIGNTLMILEVYRAHHQRLMLNHREKREYKTAFMMILVVFVFVCCNTLAFVLNFVEEVNPEFFLSQETILLAWVLNDVNNLLVIFNASITIVIYAACSEKYRRFLSTLWMRPNLFFCSPMELRSRASHTTFRESPLGQNHNNNYSNQKFDSRTSHRAKQEKNSLSTSDAGIEPLLEIDRIGETTLAQGLNCGPDDRVEKSTISPQNLNLRTVARTARPDRLDVFYCAPERTNYRSIVL